MIGRSPYKTNIDDEIKTKKQELKRLEEKIDMIKKYLNMLENAIIFKEAKHE
ncbi:hypothetical protein [Caloramator sp. Dgby_cultured_2]|uniref:hypothetical protein n=1 Tax=Caloramator sp. Dgby_cultured_2 TaxID=3029174 RepID=UPI00237EAE4F|nr:hypothetical protein [Caloramator sp. Dgby_cultured_2]WDU84229.1 hypothetical protein PWK10_07890 [Caloramator sp. Dgby_cultured_2]